MAACPEAQEIGDRTAAIQTGIKDLQRGDVLVVAGKGHETGQIIGDDVLSFDDMQAVKAAIEELRS